MELAHRWSDRNLTRLELVSACFIMTLLIGFALRSMLVFFARTEQTMVNTSIININSALKYHAAAAIMRGDREFLSGIENNSPFNVVSTTSGMQVLPADDAADDITARIMSFNTLPAYYLGEFDTPDFTIIEPGSWYFDNYDKTLNYLVRNDEFFYSDVGDIPLIKLRVVVDYNDRDGDGRYDPASDEFESVQLQTVWNYSWID